jgi:hypothetical protein
MGIQQKKEFIARLKAQISGKKNDEYKNFLNECVRVYNVEVKTNNASSTLPSSNQNVESPKINNSVDSQFISVDGFVNLYRKYFGGTLFLIGVILFTAGPVFTFMQDMSGMGVLMLALPALPIIACWFLYNAAKSSNNFTENVSPGLTLLKVGEIINFVFICIILLILLIGILVGGELLSGFGINASSLVAVGTIFIIGVFVFYIIALRAVLQVIKSMRNNIMKNTRKPLRGIGTYIVVTCIAAGFNILIIILGSIVASVVSDMMGGMGAIMGIPSGDDIILATLFGLAAPVGSILIASVFYQLGNALKR